MNEDVYENAQLETQQIDELFPKTKERSEIYYTLDLCYRRQLDLVFIYLYY